MGLTPRAVSEVFLAKIISQKAIPNQLAMALSEYALIEYGATTGEWAGFTRPVSAVESRYGKRRHASRGYLIASGGVNVTKNRRSENR